MVTPVVREVSHERAAELMREMQAELAKHAASKEREAAIETSSQSTGR
jgi:hypothetical protein